MNNSSNPYLEYYLRKDVQKQILKSAKNKEVGVAYSDHNYGKRPDVLQFESDVSELAKQGAYSFHISEENWNNPLRLRTGLTKKELDELRIGWDLVLDIDSKHLYYSKIATSLVIEAIKYHDVKHMSVKFSGNHGFHIGIPFKAFPSIVNNTETRLLFPEGLRTVAYYLKEFIKELLISKLLEHDIDTIAKNIGKTRDEIIKDNKLDAFSVVDIDTVLISSRHMFRAPYSINEKSGLVSVPIKPDEIMAFDVANAKPETVKADLSYLDEEEFESQGANRLIIQAFDFSTRHKPRNEEVKTNRLKYYEDSDNNEKIPMQYFPGCITKLLQGNMSDGRKRAIFILINFLKSTGYGIEEIKEILKDWNSKNTQPLKQGYIDAQISWHSRQKDKILPPNCDNPNYYMSLGVKDSDEFCARCKNPVNAANRAYRFSKEQENIKSTPKKRKKKDIDN